MTTPPIVYFPNGPNANLYGLDRNGTYGRDSFIAIRRRCEDHASSLGLTLDVRQSNHEGALVDWIREAREKAAGLIINARAHLHLGRNSGCAACF
jgi:3-dehydroquinate dehydratase II